MKSGRQKGGQDVAQGVDDAIRSVLCAGTEMEHGEKLGARVDGEPQHVVRVAQSGSKFVQLEVREVVLREERSCKICACSRARVSLVVMVACRWPCDPFGGGWV